MTQVVGIMVRMNRTPWNQGGTMPRITAGKRVNGLWHVWVKVDGLWHGAIDPDLSRAFLLAAGAVFGPAASTTLN